MTCSEGAFFQYMVMRNLQLTGLHQEEVKNKGEGGGRKGRQYKAANYDELFMLSMGKLRRNVIFIGKLGRCMSNDCVVERKRVQGKQLIKDNTQIEYIHGQFLCVKLLFI